MTKLKNVPDEVLKVLLSKLYLEQEMTYAEIGKKLDMSGLAIRRMLLKYNIPLKGRKNVRHKGRTSALHNVTPEEWSSLGLLGIAYKYDKSYTHVYNFYHRYKEVIDGQVREHRSRNRQGVETTLGGRVRRPKPLPGEPKL